MRRERMPSKGSPNEIRCRITNPGDDQSEQQESWTLHGYRMEPDGIGQRKSYQQEAAGADSRSGQCFDQRSFAPKCQRGNAQDKEKQDAGDSRGPADKSQGVSMAKVPFREIVRGPSRCQPLR